MTKLSTLAAKCAEHNLEVFHVDGAEARANRAEARKAYAAAPRRLRSLQEYADESGFATRAGWYWWSCYPGCLPDGDAIGPFTSATRACEDALEGL